jgi:hypothetical protein
MDTRHRPARLKNPHQTRQHEQQISDEQEVLAH